MGGPAEGRPVETKQLALENNATQRVLPQVVRRRHRGEL
jgi:hypothetical protein